MGQLQGKLHSCQVAGHAVGLGHRVPLLPATPHRIQTLSSQWLTITSFSQHRETGAVLRG